MSKISNGRAMLKSTFTPGESLDSDQQKGIDPPPLEEPLESGTETIELPEVDENVDLPRHDLRVAVARRRSRRKFAERPLRLDELAWLLWTTAGVHRVIGDKYATMRTVPSAGARHPYETYLVVQNVQDLCPGIWRYLPVEHKLGFFRKQEDLATQLTTVGLGQSFLSDAAVVFAWVAVPYRCEWRYGRHSYKAMLLDAGHIAENLYLAVEGIKGSCCAVAAYDQQAADELLGIDGEDQFTVYLAAVGPGHGDTAAGENRR